MKKYYLIGLVFAIFFTSCDFPNDNSEVTNESKVKINKKDVIPAAYDETWVLSAIEEDMNYFEFSEKSLNEIDAKYVKAINEDIMGKIYQRIPSYEAIKQEKYSDISSDLTFDGITKGDILLTVSRNASLMAIDNENTVHHGLLCTKIPTSNSEAVFITAASRSLDEMPTVQYYSIDELNTTEDIIVVLRLFNNTDVITDKAIDYAIKQLGKPYNTNFIDKMNEEAFYCSQLVWRSYFEAEVNIDYNHSLYNDYNLVLASDIYKSEKLYIVKYSK